MTTTTTPGVEAVRPGASRLPTRFWVLKRALLGLLILFIVTGGAAMLLNAAIEPDIDGGAEAGFASSGHK